MISALTTGDGTLIFASATFASVRPADRAARAAERSLLSGLRPLLMASRSEDPRLIRLTRNRSIGSARRLVSLVVVLVFCLVAESPALGAIKSNSSIGFLIFIADGVPDNYYQFNVYFRNPGVSKDQRLFNAMLHTMRIQ